MTVSINWLSSLIQRKVKFLSTCGENMIIYLHFKDFEDESEDKDNKIRRRLWLHYSFKAFEMFHLVPREDNNMINHYFANSKSCFSKA